MIECLQRFPLKGVFESKVFVKRANDRQGAGSELSSIDLSDYRIGVPRRAGHRESLSPNAMSAIGRFRSFDPYWRRTAMLGWEAYFAANRFVFPGEGWGPGLHSTDISVRHSGPRLSPGSMSTSDELEYPPCRAAMGRGTAPEGRGGGAATSRHYPSVSPAGCHLPMACGHREDFMSATGRFRSFRSRSGEGRGPALYTANGGVRRSGAKPSPESALSTPDCSSCVIPAPSISSG